MALFSRKFVSGGDPIVDPGFSKDVCASLMLFLLPFAKILQKERKTKLQARKNFWMFRIFQNRKRKIFGWSIFSLVFFSWKSFSAFDVVVVVDVDVDVVVVDVGGGDERCSRIDVGTTVAFSLQTVSLDNI